MGYYKSYYTYGLPTFLIIIIALYLLFTGKYHFQHRGARALTNDAQTRERRLTLDGSSRSRVRLRGLQRALDYVSA